ncbi:O-antigen ligase family protein [Streptomyces sp. NPDC005485]|uniref:O-antigen ligase family protein n=1 Tax=Streptomyces sp. NPDC005485 TaxID=3155591 RepID=UPI0033A069B2
MSWQAQHSTALLLGIVTLVALIPILIAARRAHTFGDWDLTSTYVFAVGVTGTLPVALLIARSGQPERLDLRGNIVVAIPGWVSLAGHSLEALLAAVSLAFLVTRLLRGAQPNFAPCIAIVLVTALAFSDGLNGRQVFGSQQLVLIAVLLAATVARPGRSAFLGAAACSLLLAVLSGIEALVRSSSVLHECREDKCGVFGVLFRGVFTNENTFGLLMALSIPFVWLALRGRARVVICFYIAFMSVATGSRTAAVAAAVALFFLVLLRPSLPDDKNIDSGSGTPDIDHDSDEKPTGKIILAAFGITGVTLIGLALPLMPHDQRSIPQRAYLWELAQERLPQSPLFGFGAKAWQQFHSDGEAPVSFSAHNQWIDTAYAGGLIGLGLLATLIGYILLRGGARMFLIASCVLAPILMASATEVPWAFSGYNWLSFILVAALLMPVPARRRAGPAPRARTHGSSNAGQPPATSPVQHQSRAGSSTR